MPIEAFRSLPNENATDVFPIPWARSKCLHYQQVLRRAGTECNPGRIVLHACTTHCGFLERKCSECHVDTYSVRCFQQKNSMDQGKGARILPSRNIVPKQQIHILFFTAKPCQKREVNVFRQSRLAPTLNRQAADETKRPSLGNKQRLQFQGFLDKVFHRQCNFINQRCCSTRPDSSSGGKFFTASRNKRLLV